MEREIESMGKDFSTSIMYSQDNNIAIVNEYPFLKIDNECYFTWLDGLEVGWRKHFGAHLCRELKEALIKDDCLNKFEFLDIKEKYGELRLYAWGYGDNTRNVLAKYEELSKYICGHCGNPARYITGGWIYPLCERCIKEINGSYTPIEDFYGFPSYQDVIDEISLIKTNFQYDRYWKTFKGDE